MSTQEMTGTNKLAERIVSDARADAEIQAEEAKKSISAIKAQSDKALAERAAEFAAKREAAVRSVLDGCRTRASLDGRKSTLAKKRVVIETVFDRAYDALLKLDAASRGAVCKSMLLREAADGDTVCPAKADRAEIEALVASIGDRKLSVSPEDAPLEGGFLLVNAGYEKDCSFLSLLGELRGDEETHIAKRLFRIEGGQS